MVQRTILFHVSISMILALSACSLSPSTQHAAGQERITERVAASASTLFPTSIAHPFKAVSTCASYHLIAWIDGHPSWESVEAFIYSESAIRAIITRKDKSQFDIVFGMILGEQTSARREWYPGEISFTIDRSGKKARLDLVTHEGDTVCVDYIGQGKPDTQHAGLCDPRGHSPDGGMPVLYREKSSIADSASSVSINGKRYAIPENVEQSVRPWFVAWSAYLSIGYTSFIVTSYGEQDLAQGKLAAVSEGSPSGSLPSAWSTSPDCTGISQILFPCTAGEGLNAICFEPAFPDPDTLLEGEERQCAIWYEIKGAQGPVVRGDLVLKREGNLVEVIVRYREPSWARESRAMRYVMHKGDDGWKVSADMLESKK